VDKIKRPEYRFPKGKLIDEAAGHTPQNESEVEAGLSSSSNNAKRKQKEEEALSKKMAVVKQEQVAFLKEFIAPTNTDNNSNSAAVAQSVIDKNLAYAEDKKNGSAHCSSHEN
jgi:hypothetical protein